MKIKSFKMVQNEQKKAELFKIDELKLLHQSISNEISYLVNQNFANEDKDEVNKYKKLQLKLLINIEILKESEC